MVLKITLVHMLDTELVERNSNQFVTVVSQHCPQPCTGQLAELKALTSACQLAKETGANI